MNKTILIPIFVILLASFIYADFYDDFQRGDGGTVGNGWAEESEDYADAFTLSSGRFKVACANPYGSNIVSREINQSERVNFTFTRNQLGEPNIFIRFKLINNVTGDTAIHIFSYNDDLHDGNNTILVNDCIGASPVEIRIDNIDYTNYEYDVTCNGTKVENVHFHNNTIPDAVRFDTDHTADGISSYIDNFESIEYTVPPVTPTASFITPPTPADAYVNNTLGQNITVNCSYQGYANIWAGSTNPPTTMVANGSNYQISWIINSTVFSTDDTYYYFGNCSNATSTASSVRSFILDSAEPPMALKNNTFFKANNFSHANQYDNVNNLDVNISVTDDRDLNSFLFNMTIANGTSYFSYLNESLTGSASWNFIHSINHTTFPVNTLYYLDIYASDSHTAKYIPPYETKKITDGIDFKTAEGNHIWITSEDAADITSDKLLDRHSINVDFLDGLEKKRVLHLYSDKPIKYHGDKSGWLAHFTIFNNWQQGGNWVDFETTGLLNPTVTVKKISDTHYTITFDKLKDKLTFNSIGGLNINHISYQWYKGSTTQAAPAATSGDAVTISLNVTMDSSISVVNAGFNYNGTFYTLTKTNNSNYSYFTKELTLSVLADTTFNYTFNVSVLQNDNSNYSFNVSGTQTIFTLLVDNCSTAKTITAIFNLRDEDDITLALNGTMEIEGTYWAGSASAKNLTLAYTQDTSHNLCLYPNTTTVYTTAYIKYTIPTGFTHRYYLVNQTLNNISKVFTLYNFNGTAGKSDLKITVRQISNYAYYPNVIGILQRKYVSEGVWRTVQMDKSGDFGQLFYNIIEENTDYRLIYWDSLGRILETTNSMKLICTSGVCDLTQKLSPYSASTTSTNTSFDVIFDNSTRQLNVSWSNPLGTSTTVVTRITRNTMTGVQLLCNATQTGASGLVNCDTSGYSGVFDVNMYENGEYAYSTYVTTDDDTLSDFVSAAEGAIWTFAIMVTIMMFGLFSPVGVVIATILGLIIIFFMGIFNPISLTFVIVATVLGIVISLKVKS